VLTVAVPARAVAVIVLVMLLILPFGVLMLVLMALGFRQLGLTLPSLLVLGRSRGLAPAFLTRLP